MNRSIEESQAVICHFLIQKLGGKNNFVQWMVKHLEMQRASVYRRLSGTTSFNLKELIIINRHFQLPFYEIFDSPADLVYFHLENNNPKSYEEWMKVTDQNLTAVCSQPNVKMHYTSTENPIFYQFHFEEITRFKLYIWARTIWEIPEIEDKKFSLDDDLWTENVRLYREKMLRTYTALPSVEFWTPNLMNNNISQIEYYMRAAQFENREDALLLCDQLHDMMDILQKQTKTGFKVEVDGVDKPGSFELYYNEILHTNNILFFTSDNGKALYVTLGNPTTIKTQQPLTCQYVEEWLQKIKSRSMMITSERERLFLINKAKDRIAKAQQLFKGMI